MRARIVVLSEIGYVHGVRVIVTRDKCFKWNANLVSNLELRK